nr:hypothetical protein [Tanacetum cinerariifolium]
RILSVVRIEVFSMYGYDYMKKIVLRRSDLNEHVITERDFKYLYPSDFEDLNLLNLQGHLNHLPPKDNEILTTAVNQWTRQLVIRQRVEDFQLGIESYQTRVNITKPQWTATGFEYKHDYTVIESHRAVIFRDKYRVQMMMRFNEIHKFSDGTLQQIDEALDYKVKEFRINKLNPGLNTRFWTRKDVDRCNAFMFAIQRRLRTRRIFRNLESFVGGRVNLTKPQWTATGFEYKHDYIVIESPRAVIFRDKYGVQMMMRFNEIHKFSDGTLHQIDEALDYKVKEFRINKLNPGLNTRFWTRKDVDRCNAFMFEIQRRLRTRRIFRNLESFVSERVREGDYRLLKRTD